MTGWLARRLGRGVLVFGVASSFAAAIPARAADRLALPVVKPAMACEDLTKADVGRQTGTATRIRTAERVQTDKGAYCKVIGVIAPSIEFQAWLPMERWTQRFFEGPFNRPAPDNAAGCLPAHNGEFATIANNRGAATTGQTDARWTTDMQLRIDWAYRANHEAALAGKALIRLYYGQAPRFSYFTGCSEGGREALMQAQRYPGDFDGISAGAPVAIDSVHNAFFHPWEAEANRLLPGGGRVLTKDRLALLHAGVMEHCAASAGLLDGVLLQPTACTFRRQWLECAPGAAPEACLSPAELDVVERLYEGASDGAGHRFEIAGFPIGSENLWKLSTATEFGDRETKEGFALRRLLPPPEGNLSAQELEEAFRFDQAWYEKLRWAAPLYNAANTNLAPYSARGGKLILWHGAADLTVQPQVSIAYYDGVRAALGAAATDRFLRFFMLPGMGHCAGGDGPDQFDVLTPLMAWTELGRAPAQLVVGKRAAEKPAPPSRSPSPYAAPAQPTVFTRPVFPFPQVARYSGKGDRALAGSYVPVRLPAPAVSGTQALELFGPDNQSAYQVSGNELVAIRR
ncbi:tannase/feruloyl esterase family alpha/beta hydrolase [Novosphingobium flavum]|uniref:Tannase/feruloyl esterase family alpha/beta hydrolase n=1 Tax=Novosphingobium flavum TaxID=1778672 RepID=A0A7X1KLT9_9SPHN|nr:tannase/feruloyl esterase family alpha/beta hydrolase [Novosphingobium flavum]MBC2665668.1 tannase/feruloyl esterase family alpha/beta hydrolase [Novosphingobium flavum]